MLSEIRKNINQALADEGYDLTLILEGVLAEQAGAQVGFGDYSTFFRAFKREYGLSPTEYRKLMEEPLPDAQILPDA